MKTDPNLRAPDLNMTESVDVMALIRFLPMPGVPRLLEAFSRIPPGVLRDSVISHAEAIAFTYLSPPEGPMADPVLVAAQHRPYGPAEGGAPAPEAPQLEAPGRRRSAARKLSLEEQVVNLRRAKKYPDEIAKELDCDAGWVSDVLKAAREEGGLKWPKLPKRDNQHQVFYTDLKFLSKSSRAKLSGVALKYGISLEQLVAARKLFVEMRQAKAPMDTIAERLKLPEKDLWQWLYKARAAGIDLPLDVDIEDAQARPVLPIRPAGAPIRLPSYASFMERGTNSAAYKIEHAAKARGLTIPEYEYMREVVVDLALSGMRPIEIANAIGENPGSITGILSYAKQYGVTPPKPVGQAPPDHQLAAVEVAQEIQNEAAMLAKLTPYEKMSNGARAMIEKACMVRSISVPAYFERREKALRLRLQGASYGDIADLVDDKSQTIRDWCKYAESVGVKFPPVVTGQPVHLAAE